MRTIAQTTRNSLHRNHLLEVSENGHLREESQGPGQKTGIRSYIENGGYEPPYTSMLFREACVLE